MANAIPESITASDHAGGSVSDSAPDNPVLDAASAIFRAHGYLGSSVQELVAATGKSRSALYKAFGDKAGLFSATLAWYVDTHVSIAVESGTPAVRRGLDDVVAAGGDGLPCLLIRSCLELRDLPEVAAESVTQTMERQWEAIIESESIGGDQALGTVVLALRYGLTLLAGAGVPIDILHAASESAAKQSQQRSFKEL